MCSHTCSKASDSVNFIVAHDGFTLADLVAYNGKHNEANGEDGNDGTNDNFSWNCGAEGETGDDAVRALRWRQMRNFQMVLMLSRGTPMVVAGECLRMDCCGRADMYPGTALQIHSVCSEQKMKPHNY